MHSAANFPADSQRNKHVIITSKWHFDVIISCLLHFVFTRQPSRASLLCDLLVQIPSFYSWVYTPYVMGNIEKWENYRHSQIKKNVIMPTVSSLVAIIAVVMTTAAAASEDKDCIMTTLSFHWLTINRYWLCFVVHLLTKWYSVRLHKGVWITAWQTDRTRNVLVFL